MVRRFSIQDMKMIARERNGLCLSKEYGNSKTKLMWQCELGHVWDAIPNSIIRGSWCPICGREKLKGKRHTHTIEEMKEIAGRRGGLCESDVYVNYTTNLKWRCEDGHRWEATPNNIIKGTWCPYCVGNIILTIEEMQRIAKSRGGECLSREYKGSHSKLKWKCSEGHIWEATPTDIKSRKWCPYCKQGVSERICRATFESLFNERFPKKKPKWLINPDTGSRMELDGYSEKLQIAFEFHGEQHYEDIKFFQSKYSLEERQHLDQLKKDLCKLNNIILLEIPIMDHQDLAQFIIDVCRRHGVQLESVSLSTYDYKNFNIYSTHKLEELKEYAKSKGGLCLSEVYINNHTKLRWQCSRSHIWDATPAKIKSGRWCPICSRKARGKRQRKTIVDMKQLAKRRGGDCLSEIYTNAHTKLRWKCEKNHTWEATPNSIQQGSWCRICARVMPGTIEEMKKIAVDRNGKCLSEVYVNARTKLRWVCHEGHEWEAIPDSIKRGSWCPVCANKKRSS